jgi:anti-sigma regulatory factor (Ser/Thr protein kinase)
MAAPERGSGLLETVTMKAKEGDSMADEAVGQGGLAHLALFYRDWTGYLACVLAFARDGLASGEPVFIAVPGHRAWLLEAELGGQSRHVSYGDMAELGRNPGRFIPNVHDFIHAHPGQRVRFVAELIWPGRSAAETCEAIRHEALINPALAGTAATLLCPYDAAGLAPAVLAAARCTHPATLEGGRPQATSGYAGALPPEWDPPLPAPPGYAEALGYDADLAPIRRLVASHARQAGLPGERAASLVLAASELAANTLCHTAAGGLVYVWHTEQEILCQVQDQGWITDPLAGQLRRPADEPGHGLWLVNQVCDLVELRSGQAGTTVRLHMRLG